MNIVTDAFGKELRVGDMITWIGNPSEWCKCLRKGIITDIGVKNSWSGREHPVIVARSISNPLEYYGGSVSRSSVLRTTRTVKTLNGDVVRVVFPRVVKL